ncbi:radical SAM protein [Acidithrix sp. C25]|uniref:radical SAM protein n=1 Tax=Acidithrix sp. C25 TaxID=1671482 RepID=UPI00191BBE96|nr:radical SAM protein [Acidithrix sp. C25]CAG4931313.1 unnamed protein product [Acidithrix sp. C25]
MNILIASTYELGHQPFSSLYLESQLRKQGWNCQILDTSQYENSPAILSGMLSNFDALLISVPMHTASSLALELVETITERFSNLPIGLFGLYASSLEHLSLPASISLLASGEIADEVTQWITEIEANSQISRVVIRKNRSSNPNANELRLDRRLVGPLENYTKLVHKEKTIAVGYTETTRGCMHQCRHCPVPVVYEGKIRIFERGGVLTDIDDLVAMGAQHITFGDPDFFNAPIHAMKIVAEMHKNHPQLTFDATIKVEHLLKYETLIKQLKEFGCLFVVSAFEHVSSSVLEKFQKGHDRHDMVRALELCRLNGIEIRPSLLPFTPWTTPSDLMELFEFVVENDLIDNIDPVQFAIRLLVPEGSLLLGDEEDQNRFKPSKDNPLTLIWESPDPKLDELARIFSDIAAGSIDSKDPAISKFDLMYQTAGNMLGLPIRYSNCTSSTNREVPRLSESWFCCAEPTQGMLAKTKAQ